MEMMTILIWAIGGGFTGTWMLLFFQSKGINNLLDKIDYKLDKLDEKITDIDRRLCRIEGSLSSRDCCMLKDDKSKKKAV